MCLANIVEQGMSVGVRVVCSGDIHIGRRLSKVDDTYRTADAWTMIVDLAIEENVDLLALSGDVIDAASKSYEALGPLQAGLARLVDAGIDTVAVAGNHDFDILPMLADQVGTERFHLLGRGGQWERFTLQRDGRAALHVDGWSFPAAHVSDPPLRSYPGKPADGVPVMGLLHGDVGVPLSRYAPISLGEASAIDLDLLVLGHIHAPQVFPGPAGRQALYVGSPWAMDPGEPGTHGVWMAEFGGDGPASLEHIPISPVRYEVREADVAGVEDESGFRHLLDRSLTQAGREAIASHDPRYLKAVSLRLHITGESEVHRDVPTWIDRANSQITRYPVESIDVIPERFSCDVRPPLNVQELAQGAGPVAEVARLIVALDDGAPAEPYRSLVNETLYEIQGIYAHQDYVRLRGRAEDDEPNDADARALLASRAWEMLSVLTDQKEEM